jgi:membrane protein DedA with SNARE-associated domain
VPAASLTSSITSAIGNHGIYAVFTLMMVGAVLPIGSELVMVYGGALASGAFASQHVAVFGSQVDTPFWAWLAVVVAGILGNLAGALIGWAIGWYGGRPFLLRRGRWLHVSEERLDRGHAWFERFGTAAVPLGFVLPFVRSFVAIPAGIARMPLAHFIGLAAIGVSVFCAATAAGGWALGSSYESLSGGLRYVDVAVVALLAVGVVYLVVRWRRRRSTTIESRVSP